MNARAGSTSAWSSASSAASRSPSAAGSASGTAIRQGIGRCFRRGFGCRDEVLRSADVRRAAARAQHSGRQPAGEIDDDVDRAADGSGADGSRIGLEPGEHGEGNRRLDRKRLGAARGAREYGRAGRVQGHARGRVDVKVRSLWLRATKSRRRARPPATRPRRAAPARTRSTRSVHDAFRRARGCKRRARQLEPLFARDDAQELRQRTRTRDVREHGDDALGLGRERERERGRAAARIRSVRPVPEPEPAPRPQALEPTAGDAEREIRERNVPRAIAHDVGAAGGDAQPQPRPRSLRSTYRQPQRRPRRGAAAPARARRERRSPRRRARRDARARARASRRARGRAPHRVGAATPDLPRERGSGRACG